MAYKISCVIPTFNRLSKLALLLTDITNQNLLESIDITVVVDGSTDGTIEYLQKEYPSLDVVVGSGEWWYTRSINEGIRSALINAPDLIVLINDDCRLEENFFQSMITCYSSLAPQSILGSLSYDAESRELIFPGISKIVWWRYKVNFYDETEILKSIEKGELKRRSFSLPGRGMLIPRNVIDTMGLLDESFPQYYSDSEYIFRANKNNISSFVSLQSKLYTYSDSAGSGNSSEKLVTFIRNFGNPYSRNNLKNIYRIIKKYGNSRLGVLTFLIKIAGQFKNYFLKKNVI